MRDPVLRITRLLDDLNVTTLADVGANDGSWAADIRAAGYAGRIVSFEPHPVAYAALTANARDDDLWETLPLALASQSGRLELRMTSDSRWASLAPAVSGGPKTDAQSTDSVRVEVRRLDEVLEALDGDRVFVKVDVQGLEVDVMSGATGIADSIVGAELEAMLVPFYENQPSLAEILDAAARFDLRPAGVLNGGVEENGQESWFDLLFVRDPAPAGPGNHSG